MSEITVPKSLDLEDPIYVAGHRGLVGSALWRLLSARGASNLIGRTSSELDLTRRDDVFDFLSEVRPSVLILAAAKVGGILANDSYPVQFLSENLQIQTNILDAAVEYKVPRLLFLGSSCIYPKFADQPIQESSLLTGKLEPTNEAYAIAKISGILQVQAVRRQYGLPWISAMPTNLYGPGDNFSAKGSHVIPALIQRYDNAVRENASIVTNWGSGTPRREFLHVDDMAAACLHLLENFDRPEQVNVGSGVDYTLAEVAELVAKYVGYQGDTMWDTSKPDGTPRKVLDVSTLRETGWRPTIPFEEGINRTIEWYRSNLESVRN